MSGKNKPTGIGSATTPSKGGRYKLLFANSRAKLPEGYSAPIGVSTTRGLMWERRQKAKAKAS